MSYIMRIAIAMAAALGLLGAAVVRSSAGEQTAATVSLIRIGVTESLCRDHDPKELMALIPPFRALAKSCTGLDCDLSCGGDAFPLAERLVHGQLELGIFQGIEFAWVRQKHPELLPLMTVLNGKRYLRACLVVPASSGADCLSDLKGQSLAISRYSLEDCYQFLEKLCREQGLSTQQLSSQLIQPSNAEEALDEVADGKIGAAIVEELSLDCYQRRKPGRFERLKIVQRSERFPATVVAYRSGGLSDEMLRVFREGMCRAHRSPLSRHLLTWWRITRFEDVPAGYQEALAEIMKVYPTPAGKSRPRTLRSLLSQANRLLEQQWSSPPRDP